MARVIVVDDSPPIREILRAILESEGHSVVEATNGIEALELVTSRHDVMILDVMMPGVDGLTVLSALNARGPDCPRVIMLTAKAGEEDRQRALLDGADGFLTKPFDTEALLAEIEGPDPLRRGPRARTPARAVPLEAALHARLDHDPPPPTRLTTAPLPAPPRALTPR